MRSIASFLTSRNFIAAAFLCGAMVLIQAGGAYALDPVEVPVKVEIKSSIQATLGDPLDFGTVETIGGATLLIDCSKSAGGPLKPVQVTTGSAVQTGNPHCGSVILESDQNMAFDYTITYPPLTTPLDLSTPNSEGLNFSKVKEYSHPPTISHHRGGTETIYIGGQLKIPQGVTPRSYEQPIDVTINIE